jgi:anti-sigma B factor antagonist
VDLLTAQESWPTSLENGTARVELLGELDLATAPALRDHLQALHLAGVRSFDLDASGLTFVDSVGLSVIVAVFRRCQEEDGRVRIVSPSPMMRRTLEVAGLADILEIVD